MYRVFLIRTNTTVQVLDTEKLAEKFCEEWGWKYDGTEGSGFIDYEEINNQKSCCDDAVEIIGVMFAHNDGTVGYWEGFHLTEEEQNIIQEILSKHDTEGVSIIGVREEITKEI